MFRLNISACVVVCLALACASAPAVASVRTNAQVDMSASVFTTATAEGCSNNPGPFITLKGEVTLGGLNGRLIFRNNVRGTHEHTEDVQVDVVLIPPGQSVRFAKQPPEGGAGGNPWIFLQFYDESWNAISGEILLGRCVQGLTSAVAGFALPADATVDVSSDSCFNSPGPYITLSGEIVLGGINARLIFRNNMQGTHEHEEDVSVEVAILPPGQTIRFAKQPPEGGAGGNPRVYFQFLDDQSNPLGGQIYLGRCVQLGD